MFFEILSMDTQSCFHPEFFSFLGCSKYLMTINGVMGTGTNLNTTTKNMDKAISHKILLKINLKKRFIIYTFWLIATINPLININQTRGMSSGLRAIL